MATCAASNPTSTVVSAAMVPVFAAIAAIGLAVLAVYLRGVRREAPSGSAQMIGAAH